MMDKHTIVRARISALLLSTALLWAMAQPTAAADSQMRVYIRGTELLAQPAARLVGDVTYVPLRAFVLALDSGADIQWDEEERTAVVTGTGLSLSVTVGARYLTANDRCLDLGGVCLREQGSLMLPVRPLAKAFGVEVLWDAETQSVSIEGELTQLESGDSFYDEEDLYWLSRIISAEARGESFEGQLAVGSVVLNRMERDYWPDTVYEVVFDRRCGVQFSPTANGTIHLEPTESAVAAAKLALEGVRTAEDSLFFLRTDIAEGSWIDENCDFVTTIGNHSFYTQNI